MALNPSHSARVLLIEGRSKLRMTQRELADAVGSSLRTVARWEVGTSSPAPWHYHKLAALLARVDPTLARDAAIYGGTTLEDLGLVPPALPPPSIPVPEIPGPPPPPARVLVDAVVCAAAEALAGPLLPNFDLVRASLRAAFAHARDLGLTPAEVVEVLAFDEERGAKAPGRAAAEGAPARSTGRSRTRRG